MNKTETWILFALLGMNLKDLCIIHVNGEESNVHPQSQKELKNLNFVSGSNIFQYFSFLLSLTPMSIACFEIHMNHFLSSPTKSHVEVVLKKDVFLRNLSGWLSTTKEEMLNYHDFAFHNNSEISFRFLRFFLHVRLFLFSYLQKTWLQMKNFVLLSNWNVFDSILSS